MDAHHHCVGEHEENVPCSGTHDEHSCQERKGECEWYHDAGRCKPTGTVLKCSDVNVPLGCHNRPECEWNTDFFVCHDAGRAEQIPCEIIVAQYPCESKAACLWLPGTSLHDPVVRMYVAPTLLTTTGHARMVCSVAS